MLRLKMVVPLAIGVGLSVSRSRSANKVLILALVVLALSGKANAEPGYVDRWYENPLGFAPLRLHTSMGFIVPAVAVGTLLLVTKKDSSLRDRLWIYDEVGLSWGYKYPNTFMPSIDTGLNFRLRAFVSIGAEFDALFPRDKFNKTTGFAIRPFARFYAVHKKTWRLYFESGGGLVFTLTEFPKPTDRDDRLGLRLNGLTKYGIGSEIRISSRSSIMVGIRHLHISNGNTRGVERNPSHDSNGFFVGLAGKLD